MTFPLRSRFFASKIDVPALAEQLFDKNPDMDPAGIAAKKFSLLLSKLQGPGGTSYGTLGSADANAVVAKWKDLYEEACYDELFDGMAQSECTDGELPSHSRYNVEHAGYAENEDVF